MKKVEITNVPYGDYYRILYHIKDKIGVYAYENGNPHIDDKGKYYEITFEDMIKDIEKKSNGKISSFVMLAESGLSGVIYRYNNYGDGCIYECGTTEGYA